LCDSFDDLIELDQRIALTNDSLHAQRLGRDGWVFGRAHAVGRQDRADFRLIESPVLASLNLVHEPLHSLFLLRVRQNRSYARGSKSTFRANVLTHGARSV